MVEISRIFKLMHSRVKAIISWRRTILLYMMLVLFFAGAIQITPVSAGAVAYAPKAKTPIDYWLAVYMPDLPYCVGQDYQVRVKGVRAFIEGIPGGEGIRGAPTPVLGIQIESYVQKEGIATLSPRYRWAMDVEQDDYEFGSVYFTLSPKKPGTTDLYFETLISKKYVEATRSIKVVNCKYRVVVTSAVSASVPNMVVNIATIARGEIKAIADNTLSGSADVRLNPNAFSECFVHQLTPSPGKAALKGFPSEDGTSLTVTVDILPIPVTSVSNATCYGSGGSSSTSNFQHPALEVSVPSGGDIVSKDLSFRWGVMDFNGEAVINVVPIEGQ